MKNKIILFFPLLMLLWGSAAAQTFTKAQVDSLLKVRIDSISHQTHTQPNVSSPPANKIFHYTLGFDGTVNLGNLNRYLLSSRNNFSLVGGKHLWISLSPYFAVGELNGQLLEREMTTDLNMTTFYQKPVYLLFFATIEKSNLRAIEWRSLVGAGIGYHLLSNPRFGFSISNAITYEETDFAKQEDIRLMRNSSRLRLDYNFFKKKILISHTVFFQPALNTNNLRWSNLLNIDIPMNKRYSLRWSALTTYESVTAVGKQNYDSRLTFGLVIRN